MWVVIVQTAKDKPLWPGLPDDYPVQCLEYADREAAARQWPGKVIMTVESYNALKRSLNEDHPNPHKAMQLAAMARPANIKPLAPKSVWRKLWEWLCKLV